MELEKDILPSESLPSNHFLNRLWVYILGGFFVGVIIASVLFPVIIYSAILFGGGFLSIIIIFLGNFFCSNHRYKKKIMYFGWFLLFCCIGIMRFQMSFAIQGERILDTVLNESIIGEGIVVEDPDIRTNTSRLVVLVDTLVFRDTSQLLSRPSRVLVSTDLYPKYMYGDRIRIQGKLHEPKNFIGDTGREFNYNMYLAKDNIFYQISFAKVEKISSGQGNTVKRNVLKIKRSFISHMEKVFSYPEAGLLSGLLLGEKSALGGKLEKDFRASGVIHVVVLSGYNVTLVADAIVRMFGFLLGPILGMIFGAVGIIIFAIITGGGATVVRASLMALLVLLARITGREYDMARALFLAGFFMVLHNPKILVFDISFQLSFLATFGLIVIAPKLENHFTWVTNKLQVRENLVATLSTQIIVLPLLLYAIGDLSLISIPANILVLVAVPWAMFFGFIATVVSFMSVLLGTILSFPAYFLLSYQITIVEFLAGLPFSVVTVPPFAVWIMLAVYVCLFYGMYNIWKNKKDEKVFVSKHLSIQVKDK